MKYFNLIIYWIEPFEILKTGPKYILFQDHYRVNVTAETYFGARHGLESLSQLITYDELTDSLQMHQSASITDRPVYPHRGNALSDQANFCIFMLLKYDPIS